MDQVEGKFYRRKDEATRCIVAYKGVTIGYAQYYKVNSKTSHINDYYEKENVYGMDQFIGETNYWNKGIGTKLVKSMITFLMTEKHANAMIMDHQMTNDRAIRCYEKCVIGVDFSKESLQGAKENCKQIPNISFSYGSALHTGLQGEQFNLVLERALIHHLTDLQAFFREALRLLKKNGYLIIQDRTPEDCMLQGNEIHIRGYFFELFPRLQEIETQRRHSSKSVINNFKRVGFKEIKEYKLWGTRKVYDKKKQLLIELSERTGRSILHELNNKELQLLQRYIDTSIKSDNNIVEQDRWTIWTAVKK